MLTSKDTSKASASILIALFVTGLLVGGLLIYFVSYRQQTNLNSQITQLQSQISELRGHQNATTQYITIVQNGTSLADIYERVRPSVVLVQGETDDGSVQGSGFVYNFANRNVVLTNFHVVEDTTSLSVTFYDGRGYKANILGTDPYSDLAVVTVDAPSEMFKPITIVTSSELSVGETVIAIGNPYGLVGSLTTGIVSAIGRTITESSAGSYAIPNIIQTSTPINPGNSGGPLLNSVGNVVGITTAIVSDSQGLGFAIPSNTILREISALVTTGTYRGHSYLGVTGQDMSYILAQENGSNVTYGWLIQSVVRNGPSDGNLQVGDIIIKMNTQIIKNNDDLASFLEEHTLPADTISLIVIRNNVEVLISITLGLRPDPT